MKKVFCMSLVLALGVTLVSSAAFAKYEGGGYRSYNRTTESSDVTNLDNPAAVNAGLAASAAQGTTFLASWTFDQGTNCNAGGGSTLGAWTTVDVTQQAAVYWHIDDFVTGGNLAPDYVPIQGLKSLWCGARANPGNPILCGYAALPGYGNGWSQMWCTTACIPVAGDLDFAFKAIFDSEPSYDATTVDYTTDCAGNVGWTAIAGGTGVWDGYVVTDVAMSVPIGGATPVRVRLHFEADTAWSDQDGLWPTNGAVLIDSLVAEGLPVEDFEGEAVGAIVATDWSACNEPGFGNYLALYKKGTGANYEDQCAINLSCYWAALNGSTVFYGCGDPPQPAQRVVEYVNIRSQYISNEIWSPNIPITGTGAKVVLRYTVYRDLPLDNLMFHVWHVRTVSAGGCPTRWRDRNFVYYGDQKDWIQNDNSVGSLLALTNPNLNVAIGVIDMCPFWCGTTGSGACHSPAPYIDQVKVLRIPTLGPQWDVRDIDTFQDNFASDGTLTGTVRADEALDILPTTNPGILPGDSAKVVVNDPVSGLKDSAIPGVGIHPVKKEVFIYLAVWPQGQPGKTPQDIEGVDPVTGARWPYMGDVVAAGVTWHCYRLDYAYTQNHGTTASRRVADTFCIDLNDNVFEPCDTICYFFGATSNDGPNTKSYYSSLWGQDLNITNVAANPMEFTCLPAGGWKRGGDILYVDGNDGFGAQSYYDGAFLVLGLSDKIDRYDVRGPSSGVSNRPSNRVQDIATQINGCYKKILWDCGTLDINLGDGTGDPEKTDDYAFVNTFLSNLTTTPGGIYLAGDRVAEKLNGYPSASAATFKSTYMTYNLTARSHWQTFGISPKGIHNPVGCFIDDVTLYGGCPLLNDFDVLQPTGTSTMEMSYGPLGATNGAVLSHAVGNARVILSGFSFAYIRDDELDGISDRAQHLHDIIVWLGNILGQPTGAGPALQNDLSQNYPNPFNPQTTIAFSIKDRGAVSVKVYNVAGELVRTLANEDRAAGSYTLTWDGRNDAGQPVSSGVYFYKLVANNFSQTKKMVLLK